MVKGITRQVVVVRAPEPKLFDQAIFLLSEHALAHGGVTEEALLREAQAACRTPKSPWVLRLFWAGLGACSTGLCWLLTLLL